jgi:hypothetical protein
MARLVVYDLIQMTDEHMYVARLLMCIICREKQKNLRGEQVTSWALREFNDAKQFVTCLTMASAVRRPTLYVCL